MSIKALLLLLALAIGVAPSRLWAQADSLGEFYPLAVGDVWQYHFRFATSTNYSAPYTIIALGDTTMPNGKRYIRFNTCPDPWAHGHANPYARYCSDFARYDSTDGTVHMYDTSGSLPAGEIGLYALREWLSPSFAWGERMKWSVFGESVDALLFPSVGSDGYIFARGIGLVQAGLGDYNDILYEYHDLVYAKIGGREYGQFLSAPAIMADPATSLDAPFPNPFATVTTIPFTLDHRDHVRLDLVSAVGGEVATLVDGEMEAGSHLAPLDGAGLPDGLYIVRLRVGGRTLSGRVVLMR
jgi:hypothetical protein